MKIIFLTTFPALILWIILMATKHSLIKGEKEFAEKKRLSTDEAKRIKSDAAFEQHFGSQSPRVSDKKLPYNFGAHNFGPDLTQR